jgi:hypothetical protein
MGLSRYNRRGRGKQAECIVSMESKRKKPKAPRTTLSGTKSSHNQHTKHHTHKITLNQGRECPLQATPAALKPLRATAHRSGAHNPDITLTLHKSYNQFLVGTSEERPSGDSQRACQRDVAEGTKVLHDGPQQGAV